MSHPLLAVCQELLAIGILKRHLAVIKMSYFIYKSVKI